MRDEQEPLARAAQAGDQRAFQQLVEANYANVYGQALRMLRSPQDAEDVAQAAFLKAWRKLGSFRFESAFSSWLYRIVAFAALDAIRRRDARRETLADADSLEALRDADASETAPPEQIRSLESAEIREAFRAALARMPERLREPLLLREQEGLSYDEIARKLGCKIGTVMSRLFHARKAAQQYLKDFQP